MPVTIPGSLPETIARRLRAAGLSNDAGLARIREWNHAAAIAARLDPERAGFRSHWKQADKRRALCR